MVNAGRVDLVGSLGIRDASGLADSDAVQNVVRSLTVRVLRLPPEVTVTGTVVTFVPCRGAGPSVRHGVATVGVLVLAAARPMDREAVAVVESALPNLAVAPSPMPSITRICNGLPLDPLTSVYNRRFESSGSGGSRSFPAVRRLPSDLILDLRPLQVSQRHLRPPSNDQNLWDEPGEGRKWGAPSRG